MRPPEWWRDLFDAALLRHGVRYHLEVVQWFQGDPRQPKLSTFTLL